MPVTARVARAPSATVTVTTVTVTVTAGVNRDDMMPPAPGPPAPGVTPAVPDGRLATRDSERPPPGPPTRTPPGRGRPAAALDAGDYRETLQPIPAWPDGPVPGSKHKDVLAMM